MHFSALLALVGSLSAAPVAVAESHNVEKRGFTMSPMVKSFAAMTGAGIVAAGVSMVIQNRIAAAQKKQAQINSCNLNRQFLELCYSTNGQGSSACNYYVLHLKAYCS